MPARSRFGRFRFLLREPQAESLRSDPCWHLLSYDRCANAAGYSGDVGQYDTDECQSSPCAPGGTCIDSNDAHELRNSGTCSQSIGGSSIQSKAECEQAARAWNLSDTSVSHSNATSATHPPGCIFDGQELRFGSLNNTGVCSMATKCLCRQSIALTLFRCACKDGFSGVLCEDDASACLSSPCRNGASCAIGVPRLAFPASKAVATGVFKDPAGNMCAKSAYDFDHCVVNQCEASTQCPKVFGGTCTACQAVASLQWRLTSAQPVFKDLPAAYSRATNNQSVNILTAGCASEYKFSTGPPARSCSGGATRAIGTDGLLTIAIDTSTVPKSTSSCHGGHRCVGAVVTSEVRPAKANEVAEFTYDSDQGQDWYEATAVLYKASNAHVRNLDTDKIAGVKAVRGSQISASQCPNSFSHDVCGKASQERYTCSADGFITDILSVPESGNYYLAFYAASYDKTGGQQLSSVLKVKSFRLLPASCVAQCDLKAVAPPPTCTAATCLPGYRDVDKDASNGCENSANAPTPPPTFGTYSSKYSCALNPGYAGHNGEIDVNECASSPCKNNATCLESGRSAVVPPDAYNCTCAGGFSGGHCTGFGLG